MDSSPPPPRSVERPDFSLTTSLRYDRSLPSFSGVSTPIYLLPYHHQRLLDAARSLQFRDAIQFLESTVPNGAALQQLIERLLGESHGTQQPGVPLKVCFFLSFNYTSMPTPARSVFFFLHLVPQMHCVPLIVRT